RVISDAELLPVDSEAGAKTSAVVLIEYLCDFDIQLFGHSAQGQVARHRVCSIAGLRDLLRDQRDLRICRDVEKVLAAQVIVTPLDASVDAGGIDDDLEGGVFDLRRVQLDFGVPLIEIAVGGDEPRLGHEIDLAVRLVNDVGSSLSEYRWRSDDGQK